MGKRDVRLLLRLYVLEHAPFVTISVSGDQRGGRRVERGRILNRMAYHSRARHAALERDRRAGFNLGVVGHKALECGQQQRVYRLIWRDHWIYSHEQATAKHQSYVQWQPVVSTGGLRLKTLRMEDAGVLIMRQRRHHYGPTRYQ